MPYLIQPEQKLPAEIRRIALSQVQRAQAGLAQGDAKGVWEARKSFKRLRTVLLLLEGSLPAKHIKQSRRLLRHTAAQLSHARRATVMLNTLNAVQGQLNAFTYRAQAKQFQADFDAAWQALIENNLLAQASADVATLEGMVKTWKLKDLSLKALRANLRLIYEDGQSILAQLQQAPDILLFHEWRKRVKQLWYALTLMSRYGDLRVWMAQVEALGEVLGSANDFAECEDLVRQSAGTRKVDKLLEVLAAQRETQHQEALRLGAEVYALKPRAFMALIPKRPLAPSPAPEGQTADMPANEPAADMPADEPALDVLQTDAPAAEASVADAPALAGEAPSSPGAPAE